MNTKELIESAAEWLSAMNARSLNRMSDVALAKGENVCVLQCLLQIVQNQQAQIEKCNADIEALMNLSNVTRADVDDLICETVESGEMCGRVECGHYIGHHKLFNGCQVSECECEQFYRKGGEQ